MSQVINPFKPEASAYVRKMTPVQDYIEQGAYFLHVQTQKPLKECEEFIKNGLRTRAFPNVRDPKVTYLKRVDGADREKQVCSLTQYLGEVIREKEIMAPTLTTYLNPKVKASFLAEYIKNNVKLRGMFKKQMFKFKASGEKLKHFFANGAQRNTKLSNNAISGAHASSSTPLYNQTSHSTLTSNCRMTSGYGNANNEKLLAGNRHYYNPDIVLNNITSIITHTDYVLMEQVISKYQLVHPTVEQTMQCIQYSTGLYWQSRQAMMLIHDYVRKLTPIQRSAFVYTGDLYHVMKYNDAFMRRFIGQLSRRATDPYTGPLTFEKDKGDSLKELGAFNEDYVALAKQICADLVAGYGKDFFKMYNEGKEVDVRIVIATAQNVEKTIMEFEDFIRMTMVTDNVPPAVPNFPNSIRRAALTSDTDSTIFTVQDWVQWDRGYMAFDEKAVAVGATMIFISSQAIIHILARMSKNAGFEDENLWTTAMKNEYYFPLFVPTSVAKHYYAIKSAQEGDVFKEMEKEIKGVHLKSSSAPKYVTKTAQNMMIRIVTDIYAGKKISLKGILTEVADMEREVLRGIKAGETTYFRLGQIQTPDSYTKEKEQSNYFHHMLWEEVFSPKYGSYGTPPYHCIKVATTLKSTTLFKEWVAGIKDRELAMRLEQFMAKTGKDKLASVWIPIEATVAMGIPEEIMEIVNSRRIVGDICTVFYYILETLGYYRLNKHYTHLVSDEY